MKENRMPTTNLLLAFSWVVAFIGTAAAVFVIIFRFKGITSLLIPLALLFGSLCLAILIRMFANIGQMVFDLKISVSGGMQSISRELEKISCDSKETNQNVDKIKAFFEQIKRHLDLKNNAHGSC